MCIPIIRQFLESKCPFGQAFGCEEGDLCGGVSIIISLGLLGMGK